MFRAIARVFNLGEPSSPRRSEGKSGEPAVAAWLHKVGAIKIVVKVGRISAQFMLIELALVWLKMHYVYRAVHVPRKAEPRSRLDEKTRASWMTALSLSVSPSLNRSAAPFHAKLAFTLFLYHSGLIFEQVQLCAAFLKPVVKLSLP